MTSDETRVGTLDTTGVDTSLIALVGLFVTALVTAQLISAKLLAFALPLTIPVVGAALVFPGGTFAYAVTYFATDCLSELYGRRVARTAVNVGFAMNFVLLALVWVTVQSPAASAPANFEGVVLSATPIVLGSLLGYLVSQNWDVFAFHALRRRTDGAHLWLRNIGSTGTSQLLDTIVFTLVAFVVAPPLLGTGSAMPTGAVVSLIAGQYLAKLLFALADTPFVYAAVGYIRDRNDVQPPSYAD
ncbi:queuosine precursor transporter [Halocalculus aciditolerans]|uniref:Probable queuosine precursor transporter n=1 Tax=Halocalculus aciditolerans TaxID=1383812 RepID=A0A830F1M1_9EURY|nr:queuosine precursor transporter [Halocalculus aciditolerans]GGL46269.1 hypothetical protein GCM10009039_00820 [Halocalculus aciditolerans]